jgi:SAM-dependent methyltransferase
VKSGLRRRAYLAGWRLTHPGRDRKCPACQISVSRFAPFGVAHRPDAQCPGCGSLERHRALWLYLRQRTDLLAGRLRVLAVAPDAYLERRARELPWDYLSIDVDPGKAMRTMDLTRLDLPGSDRDLLICFHVLEHIPDDGAAMAEMRRVLRPDGQAIVQVPLSAEETDERFRDAPPQVRAEHYGQPDHVRLYGRTDFVRRLAAAGLDAEEIVVGDAFADQVEAAALTPGERFFVVRPSPVGPAARP